jgi:signal transduction histidine kinase
MNLAPKLLYALIIIILTRLCLKGQDAEANTIELSRYSNGDSLILQNSSLLKDTSFHLNFDSLQLNPNKYAFEKLEQSIFNQSGGAAYWLRFKVKNVDSVLLRRHIGVLYRNIDVVQLFSISDDGKKDASIVTGSSFPYAQRPHPSAFFQFPITLEPQKVYTFYLYLNNRHIGFKTNIRLLEDNLFKASSFTRFEGFLVGMAFVYVALALIMWIYMRQSLFLYYFMYVLNGFGHLVSITGFGYELIWSDYPKFQWHADLFFGTVATMCFFLFTTVFFNTPQYFPKIDKILRGMIGISACAQLAILLKTELPDSVYPQACIIGATCFAMAMVLTLIIIVHAFWVRQEKESLLFFMAFSMFIMTTSLTILAELAIIPSFDFIYYTLPRSIWFFEATIFITLLGRRIKFEIWGRKAKELELLYTLTAQRQRISQDLHDDVGSTLNSITVFSELVKQQVQTLNPQAVPLLDRINLSTQELMDSISDIVWAINPKNDQFDNIILKMRFFVAELLVRKNIKITFETDASLDNLYLSLEKRKNFYLIFKEAINNVYKYAECTNLSIQIHQHKDVICMTITDDGRGFDTQYGKIGNGLTSMHNRAIELEGQLTIHSELYKGTSLSLSFPVKDTKHIKKPIHDIVEFKSNRFLF